MSIVYVTSTKAPTIGQRWIAHTDFEEALNGLMYHPSECIWMVPGTYSEIV